MTRNITDIQTNKKKLTVNETLGHTLVNIFIVCHGADLTVFCVK